MQTLYSEGVSATYPEDEFENPSDEGPVGVHRQPPSPWRPVLPFLVILVVVPLLAWGLTVILQRSGDNRVTGAQSAQSSAQSSATVQPVVPELDDDEDVNIIDQPGVEPSAAPDLSDDGSEDGDTGIVYDVDIQVLNASGVAGYAGQVADLLIDDGFTAVIAGNTSGWITQENTVFYSEPSQQATAEQVAQLAGISAVQENTNATGGAGIVVLLLN